MSRAAYDQHVAAHPFGQFLDYDDWLAAVEWALIAVEREALPRACLEAAVRAWKFAEVCEMQPRGMASYVVSEGIRAAVERVRRTVS